MKCDFIPVGLILALFAAGPAAAQGLSFSSKDPDNPITVTAEQGLEWQQNEKRFIARGNAKAVQAEVSVVADELTAHYRDKPAKKGVKLVDQNADVAGDNGSEVYRVDAIGHVTITSSTETATGAAAVYDFDKATLVLEGDLVTLTTPDGTVTAHRALQYWSNENIAMAEGDAVAVDAGVKGARRLKADTLTAYFRDTDAAPAAKSNKKTKAIMAKTTSSKGRDVTFLKGVGNVVLTTDKEIVRGDRANYNLDSGIAIVEGTVKMTRDNNQLNGGYAVVNVKGGVSRLYGSAAEAKGAAPPARVKALLAPKPAAKGP